jgi:hypothetical protein
MSVDPRQVIRLLSDDINDCFKNVDELINAGYEPWQFLETIVDLDNLRRKYIMIAVRDGYSVLSIVQYSGLTPNAINTILNSQTSAA